MHENMTRVTRNWENIGATIYSFRLDSFVIEGIDKRGNFKLVLVDMN